MHLVVRYTPAAQLSFADFSVPSYQSLDADNRWVRLAQIVPWDQLAMVLAVSPKAPDVKAGGRPTLDLRLVLGALLVQQFEGTSDERTVELIRENVYVQHFCGLAGFQSAAPFEASSMTHWRQWLGELGAAELADALAIALEQRDREQRDREQRDRVRGDGGHGGDLPLDVNASAGASAGDSTGDSDSSEPNNSGTLLIDATCAPADISFPTDTRLLDHARRSFERVIDALWERCAELPGAPAVKPRTYRREAARKFASFAKRRRPGAKRIRRCRREQLQYCERDLRHVDDLLTALGRADGTWPVGLLTREQWTRLRVCHEFVRQQRGMHDARRRRCDDRIVSLAQPHVRPIIRGKAGARVEFGPKFDVSLVDGVARVERFEYDAYHEGMSVVAACERYRSRTGCYPAHVLADSAYTRDRLLRRYFRARRIEVTVPPLGRPPADPEARAAYEAARRGRPGERNRIEGWFGVAKRRYGLARLMCRTAATTAAEVYLKVMAVNLAAALARERSRLRDLAAAALTWVRFVIAKMSGIVAVAGGSSSGRASQTTTRSHFQLRRT